MVQNDRVICHAGAAETMWSDLVVIGVANNEVHSLERVSRLTTGGFPLHLNEGCRGDENEGHDYQRCKPDGQRELKSRGTAAA